MLHQLTLDSIKDLDGGRVYEAFQQAIKRIVNDCEDRPGVEKSRTVSLQVVATPISADEGSLDTVKVQFKVIEAMPKRESKAYDMMARKGGMLVFNDLSDDNVKQKTIDQ